MGKTNDFGRRRMAAFFAARIKARRAEITETKRDRPDSTPLTATRADTDRENPTERPVRGPLDTRDSQPPVSTGS
jgi:hypothetical protein